MKALRVAQWESVYETGESRKLKELRWVATPNSHDSIAYCELLAHGNGLAHFGAWNLILQLASRCPTRGLLVNGRGIAYTARAIAMVTHAPEKIVHEAVARLLEIGWLEEVPLESRQSPGTPGDDPGEAGPPPGDTVPTETRQGQVQRERERDPPSAARSRETPPKGEGRWKLRTLLRKHRLPSGEKQCDEWAGLAVNDLQVQNHQEGLEIIEWMISRAKREHARGDRKQPPRYADHVEDLIEYAQLELRRIRERGAA